MYFMYCHHWIPKLVILIISSLGLLSLVMSALHYSIDVLYGFFLTSLVFSLYHWTIHHKLGTHSKWAAKLRYFDHPDSELSLPRRSRASPRTVEYRPMIQTSPYSLSHVISSSTTPSIRGSGQHQFTRASLLGNVKDDETDPSVIRRTYHTFHEGTGSFINLDGELINLQKAYEVSERVENEIGFENNWTEDDVEKEKKEGQGPSQV
ncbi:hypothetical protein HMI56_005488 [Coelomomyces lativittatus]|nr:hypothetical protein HMI56_005488 [Coelomomyces lativittatus]